MQVKPEEGRGGYQDKPDYKRRQGDGKQRNYREQDGGYPKQDGGYQKKGGNNYEEEERFEGDKGGHQRQYKRKEYNGEDGNEENDSD
jgi:hypothetical protein